MTRPQRLELDGIERPYSFRLGGYDFTFHNEETPEDRTLLDSFEAFTDASFLKIANLFEQRARAGLATYAEELTRYCWLHKDGHDWLSLTLDEWGELLGFNPLHVGWLFEELREMEAVVVEDREQIGRTTKCIRPLMTKEEFIHRYDELDKELADIKDFFSLGEKDYDNIRSFTR